MEDKKVKSDLEIIFPIVKGQLGEDLIEKIKPIIYANLDRGRVGEFCEDNYLKLHDYVARVATKYKQLSPFICQLQVEQSAEIWAPLLVQMEHWAYSFMIKKGFAESSNTHEIAIECSTEAAITLLSAYFPYDTDFEPWARVIVHFQCLKFIRAATRKNVIPEQNLLSLDDFEDILVSPISITENLSLQELSQDLRSILPQLSKSYREVIELIYFSDYSMREVASKMGKSIGAIYSLHFNALNELRKILSNQKPEEKP